MDALEAQGGIDVLRVGGGLAADPVLLQTVADLSGLALEVARDLEATARGIAALAAAAVGALDAGAAGHSVAHRVEPALDAVGRERERARWRDALDVHVRTGESSPSALDPAARAAALDRMRREPVDVLVIGGGITGAGIALDAATRGLRVALVEAHDIASGTSSRSSKLIHGGLRYLEMRDFGLVREALHERRLLLTRIAPHLVRPVSFLFPLRHRGWERA